MRSENKFCKFECKVACTKCRKKKQREKNPAKLAFIDLKANAKVRGIPFSLTLEYWIGFCLRTKYLELRGRSREDATIDRIKIVNLDGTVRGYDNDNIQVLKKWENNVKQSVDQKEKYRYYKAPTDPDVPF